MAHDMKAKTDLEVVAYASHLVHAPFHKRTQLFFERPVVYINYLLPDMKHHTASAACAWVSASSSIWRIASLNALNMPSMCPQPSPLFMMVLYCRMPSAQASMAAMHRWRSSRRMASSALVMACSRCRRRARRGG